jgi:hypothetical protein
MQDPPQQAPADLGEMKDSGRLDAILNEAQEDVGIKIHGYKLLQNRAFEDFIIVSKRLRPGDVVKYNISVRASDGHLAEDIITRNLRHLREALTTWVTVNGHRIEIYPYDNTSCQCVACQKEFPIHKYRPRGYFTEDQIERIEKYITGWAVQQNCGDRRDRMMKLGEFDRKI